MVAPFDRLAALVLPPRCPACGAVTEADHRFCAPCWGSLTFLTPPWCVGCAKPFAFDRGEGALCGECLVQRPLHGGARAAVAYGAVSSAVVLRLKYGGRTAFAVTAARLMARLVPDDADLLVPVPLHRWRLWARGYNQAALVGDALSRLTGVAVARGILVRRRGTPVLRGLSRGGRARAVAGAFALSARADRLTGRHVVLVDDVYTTGATANACARTLLAGGATRVTVVAWARVVDGDDH